MRKNQKQTTNTDLILDKEGVHKPPLDDDELPFNDTDFLKNLKVSITSSSEESIQFDISGIDPSIANALRRIMIA